MNTPKAEDIFKVIGNFQVKFSDGSIEYKGDINRLRQNYLNRIKEAKKWSSERIFCRLVDEFTMRNIKGEKGSKLSKYYEERKGQVNIWELDRTILNRVFEGKRFAKSDVDVTLEVRRIFKNKYKSNWKIYFNEAEKSKENNNFEADPFLQIKGVGFKTRDLGLQFFSKDFIAIDIHIRRTLFRTGLIIKSYVYGIDIPNGVNAKLDYLNFVRVSRKIANEAEISLMEMDKSSWYLGRKYCGNTPKCDICPLSKKRLCVHCESK